MKSFFFPSIPTAKPTASRSVPGRQQIFSESPRSVLLPNAPKAKQQGAKKSSIVDASVNYERRTMQAGTETQGISSGNNNSNNNNNNNNNNSNNNNNNGISPLDRQRRLLEDAERRLTCTLEDLMLEHGNKEFVVAAARKALDCFCARFQGSSTIDGTERPTGVTDSEFLQLTSGEKDNDERELRELVNVDFFVLDNSLRETTVATLKGHTLENKKQILQALRTTGCQQKEIVLGMFGSMTNVDDALPEAWRSWGENMDFAWGMTEAINARNKLFYEDLATPGLDEIVQYQFCNVILDVDTCDPNVDYDLCDYSAFICRIVTEANRRLAKRRVDGKSRVLVNLRDFQCWKDSERGFRRALDLLKAFANMDPDIRPIGMLYEDPSGMMLPETVGMYTRIARNALTRWKWPDALLLLHVHANFGLCDAALLKAVANGCNGMWGALCRTGAQLGHASIAVALVNLARLGNKHVLRKYNIPKMVLAARRVHEIATLKPCDPLQECYGVQAFDMIFGGPLDDDIRKVAEICGAQTFVRVQYFSTPENIAQALTERFGRAEEVGWNATLCGRMQVIVQSDAIQGKRWEYNSRIGLCQLYQFALSDAMGSDAVMPTKMLEIASSDIPDSHPLLREIQQRYLDIIWYKEKRLDMKNKVTTDSFPTTLDSSGCTCCGAKVPTLFVRSKPFPPDADMPDIPTERFLKELYTGRSDELLHKSLEVLPEQFRHSIPWSLAKFNLRWSLAQADGRFDSADSLMKYTVSAFLNRFITGFFAPPEVFMTESINRKDERLQNTMKKLKSFGSIVTKSLP